MPGHEMFRGMLAIPYLRYAPWKDEYSVASIRFRRLDGGTPKYMTVAGDKPRLYNTPALTKNSSKVAITEGEIDAISAELSGIPTVGVPGAQMWKPFMRELFLGYREVFVLADGDDAGAEFAKRVASTLPNSKIIPCPPGEDINSVYVKYGAEALKERINK